MSWRILPAIRIPGTGIAAVFRRENEDRANCTPRRERAAEALWGDREGCLLSHRGAGAAGPRRHALRERRLADHRAPCRLRAARPAPGPERRRCVTASPAYDRAREEPRARIRCSALPYRACALAALSPLCAQVHHHAARAARPRRPAGALSRVRRPTPRLDLGRAAKTIAVRQLGGHRLDRKSTRLNSSHSQISYAVF